MTEEELQRVSSEFNSRYFNGALTCDVAIVENWVDGKENYYADSAVVGGDGFLTGTVAGVTVKRATALYNHSKNLITIPRWMLSGESATRALLLHEMAHSAANEPDVDHGPKWHAQMKRLFKQRAPINLQDVTPGHTNHALVDKYGVGSDFWESL